MRPILHPATQAILPPRLCAEVPQYILAWACGSHTRDWSIPFDKRTKDTHRFTIADTRGPLALTAPIVKPDTSRCLWSDIEVSTHGAWWDVHRIALESAYGRTPYFEFYIDRLLPMLTTGVVDRYPRLQLLAEAWDNAISHTLGLKFISNSNAQPVEAGHITTMDFRHVIIPDITTPYRQIRADKLGFIPRLSVLDLIFNLGPEAQIYLNKMAANLPYNQLTL